MLVLTRRIGEKIIVGDKDLVITVLDSDNRGGRVKIGISAPKETAVHREEIYKKIKRQNA